MNEIRQLREPNKALPPPTLSGFRSPHELLGTEQGDVLLALSGGADSMALLRLLAHDAKKRGYRLAAVHVNHGIRSQWECAQDQVTCSVACYNLRVPFHSARVDIPTLAAERGMGIEECAREERYRIFEELMQKEGFPILVTAHHADDNLETLLLHMTRGASADGLCGIRPVRPFGTGHLVRPMLSCQKADILEFCEDYDLPYVTDSTNADTAYARNRLRAEVTPVLRTLNPRVATASVRLCADAARDADCLGALAEELLRAHMTEDGIALSALQNAHEAIASRALCSAFLARSGGVSLSHVHVDALLALVRAATPHASCDLPMHLCAVVEGGRLRFDRRRNAFPLVSPYEQELFEGVNVISQTNFEIFIGDSQTPKNVYKNSIRLYINPATIKGRLTARNRHPGDAILCGGMHKDVRRLFSAHALPLALRQSFPILCDDDGILAVPSIAVRDGSAPNPNDPQLCITVSW